MVDLTMVDLMDVFKPKLHCCINGLDRCSRMGVGLVVDDG
jgi:hypothetical protein